MAAATLAGALCGAALGGLGAAVAQELRSGVGALLATALLVVSLLPRLEPLQLRRETSQALLGLGPRRWAAANGALLAIGLVSRVGFWVWYVVPLACFASGSIAAGATIWGTYGLARMGVASCAAYAMRADSAGAVVIGERLLGGRARAEPASRAALAVLAAALSLQLGL